jgi:hypothetical protein
LIGDGTFSGISNGVNGNIVGTNTNPIDPLLGPLQNNGGPTQTMALLPGSPAIGHGDNAKAPTTDQRGSGPFGENRPFSTRDVRASWRQESKDEPKRNAAKLA